MTGWPLPIRRSNRGATVGVSDYLGHPGGSCAISMGPVLGLCHKGRVAAARNARVGISGGASPSVGATTQKFAAGRPKTDFG